MLTQVNYRTGRMHDMAELTRPRHAAGALVVWDLAHSAGARAGGPARARCRLRRRLRLQVPQRRPGRAGLRLGASAPRRRMDASSSGSRCRLAGPRRAVRVHARLPAGRGVARFICGTPPVLSMAALECGVDTVLAPSRWAAWRRCAASRWR
jgi:kynureninase